MNDLPADDQPVDDVLAESRAAAAAAANPPPPADDQEPPAHIAVDPLELAGQLLVDAFTALRDRPPAAQRLEHKIELGQALANLAEAQAARATYQLNQQMAALHMQDRNAALAKAAGPAGIVVPSIMPNGRG